MTCDHCSAVDIKMNELITPRLSELKKKSFAELSQLPPYHHEKIKQGKKRITVAIWTDKISDRELQVVVQAYRSIFLGIGRMEAKGFVIDATGRIRDLTTEELYDFT